MRTRKEVEEKIDFQRPGISPVKVNEENKQRILYAILNTNIIQNELLLDIRDCLKEREVLDIAREQLDLNRELIERTPLADSTFENIIKAAQEEARRDMQENLELQYTPFKWVDTLISTTAQAVAEAVRAEERERIIREMYFTATLYSDGSATLMHDYMIQKYPEIDFSPTQEK